MMKKPENYEKPKALCYIRLSMSRDENDTTSPERQRANIQAICDQYGFTPLWFEDTVGHMSGRTEKRPGWQELKTHLHDPDVVAVIANDLSRYHRKVGRMSDLLEECEALGIAVLQAAPGRNFDTSTPVGKMFANFQAMMDQGYADDVSYKMKDSVRYRREKGITIGMVPFGTIRPVVNGKPSFLQPNPNGVWLQPDGSIVEGVKTDVPPAENAIWRGYADAAERALVLFSTNRYGRRSIATILNQEGYRHIDVHAKYPRPDSFNQEHVRSIIMNWPEYGGVVIGKKARARDPKQYTPETVKLIPERAVFELDLLYKVARVAVKRTRTRRQPDYSTPDTAADYPLSNILYCADCDRLAVEKDDPSYRSYLNGMHAQTHKAARYRHKERNHQCNAKPASVKAEIVEADFERLVRALTVRPEVVPVMTEWFNQLNMSQNKVEARTAALAEIANLRQQIKNTDKLFMSARITEQEHIQHIADCERKIARLQADLSEKHEIRQLLEMTVQMLTDMDKNWSQATQKERQQFARSLFSEIVYDLSSRRIVGFKLKTWAEPFLQLRVALSEATPADGQDAQDKEQKYSVSHPEGYWLTRLPIYAGRSRHLCERGAASYLHTHPATDKTCRKVVA